MSKPIRFASAVSLAALASVIAGCAAPQGRVSYGLGGKADGEVGLATRALAALSSNDIPTAINLAERAVEKTPDDGGFRALLGNAYFAGGRFASAESAYKDSLAIYSNQPQVVLRLALVEIAQGKKDEATTLLGAARDVIDPSDYGLALALAGRPSDAIAVLEPIARGQGSDARVRQNLALAYAFSGNWDNARAIAAQDVPANQLEGRIHQWIQLANPAHPSDQLAALIGVAPAASDPGQPLQLALRKAETRQAQAAPAPPPAVAEAAPRPISDPAPVIAQAYVPPAPPPVRAVEIAMPAPSVMVALDPPRIANAAFTAAAKPARVHRASAPARRVPVRNAVAHRNGNANAVVQLGAYSSAQSVAAAWNVAVRRYGSLGAYVPVSARFNSSRGPVYRLSVKGFTSIGEANGLCASVRRAGGGCFVRNFAGDAPVQIASR